MLNHLLVVMRGCSKERIFTFLLEQILFLQRVESVDLRILGKG